MNIYLLRHGETEHNYKGVYYGKLDININENGLKQCKTIKKVLDQIKFNLVYTSTMKRTVNTAKQVLDGKSYRLIKDYRLNEMNMGVFEGKNYKQLEEIYPNEWKQWCNDWKGFAPPEGENFKEFYIRIKGFINELIKLKEENVLIVTHGGVIKCFYTYILGEDPDMFWKFSTNNGDLSLIKYEYGNFYIDFIMKNKIYSNLIGGIK